MSGKKRIESNIIENFLREGKTVLEIAELTQETPKYIYNVIFQRKIPGYKKPSLAEDLTKKKFGRLQPKELAKPDPKKRKSTGARWICKCDCGKIKEVSAQKLKHGTISCGCYRDEINSTGYKDLSGEYWRSVEWNAIKRKIDFNITKQQAWEIYESQNKQCALTKLDIVLATRKSKTEQTASLDRKDSSKGYAVDNIQWVHKYINIMKWDLTQLEFIDLCKLVANNN